MNKFGIIWKRKRDWLLKGKGEGSHTAKKMFGYYETIILLLLGGILPEIFIIWKAYELLITWHKYGN